MRLTDCAGNVLEKTHTDTRGLYLFSQLLPGSYRVKVVPPAGRGFTARNAGLNESVDSDVDGSGLSVCVTLAPSEDSRLVDAGLMEGCPACVVRYPFSSADPRTSVAFNRNQILRAYSTNVLGAGDTIKVWYNAPDALLLGVRRVIVKTSAGNTTTP